MWHATECLVLQQQAEQVVDIIQEDVGPPAKPMHSRARWQHAMLSTIPANWLGSQLHTIGAYHNMHQEQHQ